MFLLLSLGVTHAQTPVNTTASNMILIDMDSGVTLSEKNAEQTFAPASLTKMMTAYILFSNINEGFISLEDTTVVSENAWKMKGSRSFLDVNKPVSFETLAKGLIVQSGNDAAVAIAEAIAGNETSFAAIMNDTALSLGMYDTNFVNASGWPHTQHYSTVSDIAKLATALIHDFPEFYAYYKIPNFTHNEIKQSNRNPLLYMNLGADGVKTGYTEKSGYALVASAIQRDRRVLLVISGLNSKAERAKESARIVRWAFSEWQQIRAYEVGENIAEIGVLGSDIDTVYATVNEPVIFLIPRVERSKIKLRLVYDEPLKAPVQQGDDVGRIELVRPNNTTISMPLIAANAATDGGIFARVRDNLHYILTGSAEE